MLGHERKEGTMGRLNLHDLKGIRSLLGISQVKLGKLLHTSARAVQSYEQGWRPTPPRVQCTIAIDQRSGGKAPRRLLGVKILLVIDAPVQVAGLDVQAIQVAGRAQHEDAIAVDRGSGSRPIWITHA